MLTWISLLYLVGFFIVGGLDGIYFHIVRFRLWARPESWAEHVVHSIRAALLAPTIWALYLGGRGGLYVATVLIGLDIIATALDVLVEPESRKKLGGVPRSELALHIAATVFHVGAIGLGFAAGIAGHAAPRPDLAALVATVLIAMAGLAAIHHVALAFWGLLSLRGPQLMNEGAQ